MTLFEEYRGFDIWDVVEAVQVTPENIKVLAELTGGRVLEEPSGIPVALQTPDITSIDEQLQVAVKLWDFLVKTPGTGYQYWPTEQFKNAFAKNV